jgi:hypothetical protein
MDARMDGMTTCQLCGERRERTGKLIDPNGHSWVICDLCINWWWDNRQEMSSIARHRAIAVDEIIQNLRKVLEEGS